jgi:hypothetical protein
VCSSDLYHDWRLYAQKVYRASDCKKSTTDMLLGKLPDVPLKSFRGLSRVDIVGPRYELHEKIVDGSDLPQSLQILVIAGFDPVFENTRSLKRLKTVDIDADYVIGGTGAENKAIYNMANAFDDGVFVKFRGNFQHVGPKGIASGLVCMDKKVIDVPVFVQAKDLRKCLGENEGEYWERVR